jgi:hypothetical protein
MRTTQAGISMLVGVGVGVGVGGAWVNLEEGA